MKFSELKIGQRARVAGLGAGSPLFRQKLIAMGLLPGTEFTVSRVAPLGDPIEISVRGYALSLRKYEAEILKIVECT